MFRCAVRGLIFDIRACNSRADRIKITKFLSNFERFVDDAFLFIIVAHFCITTQRKIFTERKTIRTMIG